MKIPNLSLVRFPLVAALVVGVAACGGPGSEAIHDGTAVAHPDPHAAHGAVQGARVAAGASSMAGPDVPPAKTPRRAPSAQERARPAPLGEESIYQLPGTWRDRTGGELELSDLAGRPRVLAFVYTSCTFACPRIVARMKWIEDVAGPDSDVGFVLVSIDPERDTPERLAHFAEGSRLDAERWTLLNGGPDRLLELAVLLGVKYRDAGDGQLAHDNALILLDEDGIPVAQVDGLESELGTILERVAPSGSAPADAERIARDGDSRSAGGAR